MIDPEVQPESRRIFLDVGLTYHVLIWRGKLSSSGPATETAGHLVVLLHGFLDLAWGWNSTVLEGLLTDGPTNESITIVAPDLRGHGDSDRVGTGGYYHFLDYLADLDCLLDHLRSELAPQRISLVGHSMGGTIASYYAGAYPDRIYRLALLEGLGPPDSSQAVAERVPLWINSWRHALRQAPRSYRDVSVAASRLRAHDPLLDEAQSLWLAERSTTRGPDGALHFKYDPVHLTPGALPFRGELAESFWKRITCPVLLVEGSVSALRHTIEETRQRATCFAQLRKVELEGAGHMMQRHQPAALAAVLRQFLFT